MSNLIKNESISSGEQISNIEIDSTPDQNELNKIHAPLTEIQRKRAAELWDNIFTKLERDAKERYPTDDVAERTYNKAVARAKQQFYPQFDEANFHVPLFMDKYIDELYRRYGIGTYAYNNHNKGKGKDALQWFESYPAEYGPYLAKKFNKMTERERKRFRKARKRHDGDGKQPAANCGYRKPVIDWLRVHKLDKKRRKLSFDPRESWNLDHALALLLYPRFAYYRDNLIGYPSEFGDKGEYIRRVLDPIIGGLRDQIIWDAIEYDINELLPNGVICAGSNNEDNDANRNGNYILLSKLIDERIARAYQLMGKHMREFWD